MQRCHVAVAGNIGAGKSSLTAALAAARGATPVYEAVAENPYLEDFYADMRTYGFRSQVFFLTHRFQQQIAIARLSGFVVQDRSLYEDAEIFAANLRAQGLIDARDWRTYQELYEAIAALVPVPDLVVYLRASLPTLERRIALRGRAMEKAMPRAYLIALNELYESWARSYARGPLITIDADTLDFVARPADFAAVLAQVDAAMAGSSGGR
jgi:deoxyadenosine/deoxycytidine kinase